jgi:integrase
MAEIVIKYLIRIRAPKAKGGRVYWYYRREGRRYPLPAPTDPGFSAAYDRVHRSFEAARAGGVLDGGPLIPGTFGFLWLAFRQSADYKDLSPKEKKACDKALEPIARAYRDDPVCGITREWVIGYRDRFTDRPRWGMRVVRFLRRILGFAADRSSTYGLAHNPASRIPRIGKVVHHRPWEEHEIDFFRARWPVGTRERRIFELYLGTGQRGGDVARMAKPHFRKVAIAGVSDAPIMGVSVVQEKTRTRLWVPLSRDLLAALGDALSDDAPMALLPAEKGWRRKAGAPIGADRLKHILGAAIAAVPELKDAGLTAHGLRYAAATRLYELGCDFRVVAAVTGHKAAQMARQYADNQRASALAVVTLDAATRARHGKKKGDGE